MSTVTKLLAICLLFGTALLGAGAAMHPMLMGDAAGQLRIIAATSLWRTIHLGMLAGSALVVAGVWVRLVRPGGAGVPLLTTALAIIAIGETVNALNTAYMTGAGWQMALRFAQGDASMASIFAVTHPIGLVAARFGNFIVALGAIVLGFAEWRDTASARWIAALAWLAAAGGLVGVFFDESTRETLAAVALLSGWQVVTAMRALVAASAGTTASAEPSVR